MTASLHPTLLRFGKFLPGASTDALVGTSFYNLMSGEEANLLLLPWWAAAIMLASYGIIFLLLDYLFR